MSRVRRLVTWTAYAAGALIVIVALALVAVQTAWFKNWLRTVAVSRASAVLNGELSIGRISGSLWRGVTLENVRLVQDGRAVLEADRVDVTYDPWVLAHRRIIFDDIVVHRPVVRVVQEEGGWNVAHLTKPSTGTRKTEFSIRRIRVTDGDVTISPLRAAPRRVSGVMLDAAMAQTAASGFAMTIAQFTGRDERSGFLIRELAGTLAHGLSEVDVRFTGEGAGTTASGRITAKAGEAARTIDGTVAVAGFDLARFLEDARFTTDVTGDATLHAALPAVAGEPAFVDFTFKGPHAAAFGYEATDVAATGRYGGSRVTFDARAAAYGARATAAGVWRLAGADRGPGVDVRGSFASLDLRRVPRQLAVPPVPSRLNGRYTLATSPGTWSVDAVLAESAAAGAAIGAGTVGHAESSGGALRWSAEGHLANLDLQALAAPLSIETLAADRYDSQLTGTFQVAGSRPRAAASTAIEGGASLVDSRLGRTRLPAMNASMTLNGRRLSVDAHGAFEHLDAAAITGASGQSRDIDLNGTVDGVFVIDNLDLPIGPETIDFDGRVTVADSMVEGVAITRALVDAQLLDGLATIRELSAEGPDAHLKAEGVVALAEEAGESSLRVNAELADLSAVGRHVNRPLAGSATVAVTITGPPSALRAAGTIDGQQLEYGTTASALTLASTFTALMPDLQISRATVDATTEATLIKVGGVEMVRAAATTKYGDRRLEIDGKVEQTNRTLDMAGVLTLEPEARAIELTRLALSTAGTSWSLPAGQAARIRYGADSVSVEGLALVNQAQRIDAEGVLSAGAGTSLSAAGLTVRLSAVQVAEINRLLIGTRQLGGEVNGVAHLSGSLKAPAVDAELSVTNGTVENVKYEGLTATVKSDGPVMHINATLAQTAANRLTAVGTIPYRLGAASGAAPGDMDLRVESTPIDLGLAQMFTSEVSEVVGTGTVNAHVTGPFAAPKVDGVVTLAGGGFLVGATGVRYSALNATLGFESSHVRIDAFQIADDDGHVLTAEGGVDVVAGAQGRALDVHLRGEDFHILRNRLGDVAVDTDLRASGTMLAPRIEGSIRVDEGRLEVDQILERTTKNAYSTTPAESLAVDPTSPINPAVQAATASAPAPPSGSVFDQMDLRLNVVLPDNLVLRGRDMRVASTSMGLGDMNIIAGGSFDITKPSGGTVAAQGTLEIQRGYYSFQGKRFEVQRGSDVRFRGGPPTNPALQISAEREVSGVTAAVQIRGTARNPRIALSSRPPLDESDILSLIIFDRPVNDLASAERVSLAERAGSLAANAIATPLADSVARALNLDVFEIQTGASSGTSPAVTLGSQIGSRLFVGVRQEFGHGDASTVTFEYRISQLLRLVTSVAYGTLQASTTRRTDTGGIDLIYVIRY